MPGLGYRDKNVVYSPPMTFMFRNYGGIIITRGPIINPVSILLYCNKALSAAIRTEVNPPEKYTIALSYPH